MVRIAIYSLILAMSGATVAKAEGWRVALPERRNTIQAGKVGVNPRPTDPAGPAKVALPPPAITRTKHVAQDDDDVAEVLAPRRRSAAAEDPDMPIARENARPHAQRYGPERLRSGYQTPPNVSAKADTAQPTRSSRVRASATDVEVNRDFAGHIQNKLSQLRAQEGVQNAPEPVRQTQLAPQPAVKPVASIYARLCNLQGMDLMGELHNIGEEIMLRNPVGTPVAKLRAEYRELVQFVSERTGIPIDHIYRVMDLESRGGQYWVENAASGAAGLVQVRPIALEELQRLRPEEFMYADFIDISKNPALNLYVGMSYAAEKHQDWDHYSGHATGYADYVVNGKPGA